MVKNGRHRKIIQQKGIRMATSTEELQIVIDIDKQKEPTLDTPQKINQEVIHAQLEKMNKDEEHGNLKKIIITKDIFEQIRKSLTETIKSMEKNPSLFSRAAEFWGELPLWQKIIGGAALTLPTLILGIVANVGFLLAICGVTAVTYAAGGIILDDHHRCSTSVIESLQQGILGLADLLELTINALDVIREQLEAEITKFVKENERLLDNINELSQQIDALDIQVRATSKITATLGETKDDLVKTAETLQGNVAQQSDLLIQNQEKLARITAAYSTNQSELASKISEISKIKKELEDEMIRAKSIVETLHASIADLSAIAIGDEQQRSAFKEKLDVFLRDKESSFHQLADRICDAERKLATVQKELVSANDRYQELLAIQGQHIDRLEVLGTRPPKSADKPAPLREVLSKNGIYKIKTVESIDPEILREQSPQYS